MPVDAIPLSATCFGMIRNVQALDRDDDSTKYLK